MKIKEIVPQGVYTDNKGHFRTVGKIQADNCLIESKGKYKSGGERECALFTFCKWARERCLAWEENK